MGKLITLEGIDGSGKGTQFKRILEYLEENGLKCGAYGFPLYTSKTGKIISDYLTGEYGTNLDPKQVCLFYAANRVILKDSILEALECNDLILMDRYTYSNLYSISRLPRDKWDEGIQWLEELEFEEFGLPRPDYNFYLHLPPYISIERTTQRGIRDYQNGKSDIHESNTNLLQSASDCYLYLASKRPQDWIVINQMIDGSQMHEEKVFKLIKMFLDVIINSIKCGEDLMGYTTTAEMVKDIVDILNDDDDNDIITITTT